MPITYNRLPGSFTFLLFAGLVLSCDLFNNSMVNYFLDNNEVVQATGLKTTYTMLDDDTILIPPGTAVIEVILSNPRNLSVRQELLGVPDGKTITARQIGPEEIEVKIDGALDGDEYTLTLVMQSPDGLRDFPAYSLRIKCVSSAPPGITSNANLSGISIGGTPVTGFSSTTYSYSEYETGAPSDKGLTVTAGTPGQTITASLNAATPVALTSGSNHPLTGMNAANSLVITVTAPDGFTQQTYTVSYTYEHTTEWYVAETGSSNSNTGTEAGQALASVSTALTKIKAAYTSPSWPGRSDGNPVAARINISGTITESVVINGSDLPPILLAGSDQTTDKIKATGSNRALTIGTAKVILGNGLTLTGGTTSPGNGGAVYVDGTFIMNGGSISGNTATNGGGVYVTGNGSIFTMNGGTISGNEATNDGGGVYVTGNSSIFTMNGGTISNNNSTNGGGGVMVYSYGKFIMEGGSLNENRSNKGGGICLYNSGTFEMNGGTIIGNTSTGNGAVDSGGGVQLLLTGNSFTMTGGTISGNSSATSGGGVSITDSYNTFAMSGNARVDTGNTVYLNSGRVITLSGPLTANPAANIETTGGTGTQVLGGSNIITGDNYKKFQLNGQSNAEGDKIGTDGKIK